jgi:hypothetical protein
MPRLISDATANQLGELLRAPPARASGGPGALSQSCFLVKCGTLISSSPQAHYNGTVQWAGSLAGPSDATGAADGVILADLDAGTLTPGSVYLAYLSGTASDGRPILWCRESGSGGGTGGCSGCGWVAGLTDLDCLLATVVERLGRCACATVCVNTSATGTAGVAAGWGDSGESWTFEGGTTCAEAVDGSFVTSNGLEDGEQGESLKFTGFGFTVPSGATLQGFMVELLSASDGTGTETTDLVAILIVGGSATGTNHASPTPWPATAGTRTYGGATDMWGLTPTVEQVNASDFGFSLRVQNEAEPAGGTSTPKIDAVRMTVYYCVDGDAPAGNDIVYLASADGEEWEPAEDADPGTVTICGVEYALTFSREGCDGPCLTLTSDGGTAYTAVRDCCGPNYAIFSIGNVAVCSGTTDTAAGPVGNTVRIKVEWTCCPADGYAGAGYYCVRDAGTSDLCVAVEVTSAADVCADEVEICDGPYSTLEEAQAACPEPTPATVECCVSEVPAALNLSVEFGGTGNYPDCPPHLSGSCVLYHVVDIPAAYPLDTPRPTWIGGYETTYVGVEQPVPPYMYMNYQLYCDDWSVPGSPRWHIRMTPHDHVMSAAEWAEFMETGSGYCNGYELTGTCGPLSLSASGHMGGGQGLGCTSCSNGVSTTISMTVTE